MMVGLLSTTTIATIGLTCKAFLNLGFCSVEIVGLPTLLDALRSDRRANGQAIVTVANHISTLDDPLMWGILPIGFYLRSHTTRWALGASDIIFTNPVFATFFRHGQVLETFRGKGIYQSAVDVAIGKLNHGSWVHLFGEGKVNQPKCCAQESEMALLPRFKWGVGRILMETRIPPIVIPIWLSGFDNLMPEGRRFPYKYLPRLGSNLSITIGSPIPPEDFRDVIGSRFDDSNLTMDGSQGEGWMSEARIRHFLRGEGVTDGDIEHKLKMIRSDVTAVAHRAVEGLGRKVSGNCPGGDNITRQQQTPL